MEQTLVDEHISEDALELYAMGRLADPEAAELEEHILLCPACQEALEQTDGFILAFRTAAKSIALENRPLSLLDRIGGWWRRQRETFRMSFAVPALAVSAVVLAVAIAPVSRQQAGLQTIRLESARGEAGIVTVKTGSRLQVNLDSRGLPDLEIYRVELVDGGGTHIWSGEAKRSGQELAVTTEKPVPEGHNWIRVYGPGGRLLREFGILARAQ